MLDLRPGLVLQSDPGQQFVRGQAAAVEASEELQDLTQRQEVKVGGGLKLDAYGLLDLRALPMAVHAQDVGGAGGRRLEPFTRLQCGRLAGAVGAPEAADFAPR